MSRPAQRLQKLEVRERASGRVGEWASGRVGVCFCGNFSNGAVTEAGAGDEHPRAAFATST